MQRSNPRKLVTQVLGSLKKQHGATVQVYKQTSESTNWRTGVTTETSSMIEVDNCIDLPVKVTPEVVQSISHISANKQFMMGGYFQQGKRNFIFDFAERRGLPTTDEWELTDWIVIEEEWTSRVYRYDVERFEELHFGAGWMVTATRVEGNTPVVRTANEMVTHTLQLRLNIGSAIPLRNVAIRS